MKHQTSIMYNGDCYQFTLTPGGHIVSIIVFYDNQRQFAHKITERDIPTAVHRALNKVTSQTRDLLSSSPSPIELERHVKQSIQH